MVGSFLIIDTNILIQLGGYIIMGTGLIFIFLSYFKNMSDEDLEKAMAIKSESHRKTLKKHALKLAENNKDNAKQLIINNKDVIGKVAYDNRDVITQAAYDNKELLAEQYIKN